MLALAIPAILLDETLELKGFGTGALKRGQILAVIWSSTSAYIIFSIIPFIFPTGPSTFFSRFVICWDNS